MSARTRGTIRTTDTAPTPPHGHCVHGKADRHVDRSWDHLKHLRAGPAGETLEELIRLRAYELYVARIAGGKPGSHEEDWLQAEGELLQERREL